MDLNKGNRIVAIANILVVLFIPTIITTVTHLDLNERTFLWPWLSVIWITPKSSYVASQVVVSGIPWTLLLFAPSLYIAKLSRELYMDESKALKHAAQIFAYALGQMLLIFIFSKSQTPLVDESSSIQYYPQWIILAINGYYAYEKNSSLLHSASSKNKLEKDSSNND